jgi:hypothetical protein
MAVFRGFAGALAIGRPRKWSGLAEKPGLLDFCIHGLKKPPSVDFLERSLVVQISLTGNTNAVLRPENFAPLHHQAIRPKMKVC